MDFREGPTSLREQLKTIDDAPDSPSLALLASGSARGIVRIESCSRVEWVISSEAPGWAAELLRSSLLSRAGERGQKRSLHVKTSRGAAAYLFRLALGIESVAEGEHAVGRQVLRSFEDAHANSRTDRTLHLCWHAIGRVLQLRKGGAVGGGVGVQSLVACELDSRRRDAEVLVLGQGDIGKSVMAALARSGFSKAQAYTRATRAAFDERALAAPIVVACTGAPDAHLELPTRDDGPLAIDLGSPVQVRSAPGWKHLGLDELLVQRGVVLTPEELHELQELSEEAAEGLSLALTDDGTTRVLEVLENEKRRLFDDELDDVLARLPPREARELTARLRGFTHRLVEATRRVGRV
jgi:glutamyl-tRNA reductase